MYPLEFKGMHVCVCVSETEAWGWGENMLISTLIIPSPQPGKTSVLDSLLVTAIVERRMVLCCNTVERANTGLLVRNMCASISALESQRISFNFLCKSIKTI